MSEPRFQPEPASISPTPAPRPSDVSGSAGGSSMPSGRSGSPSQAEASEHSLFQAFELAIVLSHYDLGVIHNIRPFRRGSRKAPKVRLKAEKGRYLLKRRTVAKADRGRLAFAHALQVALAQKQFPLPRLIGTRRENHSMICWDECIYELFEFINGNGYDGSIEATYEAGKTLGLFHRLVRDFQSEHATARGSYHRARAVDQAFSQLAPSLERTEGDAQRELVSQLKEAYEQAGEAVEALGLNDWPSQVVHSDWHPGNMLFRGPRIVAVIDYDAARYLPRVTDVANGALQFSIRSGGEDLGDWPEDLDVTRFKRFLRGYDSVHGGMLTRVEVQAVPPLMIEALIAESVIPVAATGAFVRHGGSDFLRMVLGKVRWLQQQADELVGAITE